MNFSKQMSCETAHLGNCKTSMNSQYVTIYNADRCYSSYSVH